MQDDVKAGLADLSEIARIANDYDLRERIEEHEDSIADSFIWRDSIDAIPNVLSTLAALQERCERLEEAARAALPFVVGEEEATALEQALAP